MGYAARNNPIARDAEAGLIKPAPKVIKMTMRDIHNAIVRHHNELAAKKDAELTAAKPNEVIEVVSEASEPTKPSFLNELKFND